MANVIKFNRSLAAVRLVARNPARFSLMEVQLAVGAVNLHHLIGNGTFEYSKRKVAVPYRTGQGGVAVKVRYAPTVKLGKIGKAKLANFGEAGSLPRVA